MTEERDPGLGPETETEETSPEAVDEESAAPEVGGAMEGGVEEEEGREAEEESEELDERGVPIRNKLAEMERKLRDSLERSERLAQQLAELTQKPKEEREEEGPAIFDQLMQDATDDEFKAAGFSDEHIKLIRRAIAAGAQQQTLAAVKKADRERKELYKMRQQAAQERTKAIQAVAGEIDEEFGGLVVKRGEGWDWDRNSDLFKRASEIYTQDQNLRNSPHGEAQAARKAYLELYREKYGKKPPSGDSKLKKSQRLMGKGGSKGARGAMKDAQGNYVRELSWSEVEKLDPQEQTKYMVASVQHGWNKNER